MKSSALVVQMVLHSLSANILLTSSKHDIYMHYYRQCVLELFSAMSTERTVIVLQNTLLRRYPVIDASFFCELFVLQNYGILHYGRRSSSENTTTTYKRGEELFVVEFENLKDLQHSLPVDRQSEIWEHYTKFVIVSKVHFESREKILPDVIAVLVAKNIYNFIILLASADRLSVDIFKWIPSQINVLENTFDNIESIGRCHPNTGLELPNILFVGELPRDYIENRVIRIKLRADVPMVRAKYRSKISIYDVIFELLSLVVEHLKMNPSYFVCGRDMPIATTNCTTRAHEFSILKREEADIVASPFSLRLDRIQSFHPSVPFQFARITWAVPHAKPAAEWKLITNHLGAHNSLILGFLLISISGLIWIICMILPNESPAYRKLGNSFLNVWSFTTGHSVNVQPTSSTIRLLCMCYILHSFLFTTYYLTYLTSALAKPHYESQIKNEEGILAHDLKVTGPLGYGIYFSDNKRIAERIEAQKYFDIFKSIKNVAEGANIAVIYARESLEDIISDYLEDYKQPLFYIFETNIVMSPVGILMRRNYFLKNHINMVIRRLISGGFVKYWKSKIERLSDRKLLPLSHKFMNMKHLQAVFVMLSIGLGIATIAFILECVLHKRFGSKMDHHS